MIFGKTVTTSYSRDVPSCWERVSPDGKEMPPRHVYLRDIGMVKTE
jgi:hypothetical protein